MWVSVTHMENKRGTEDRLRVLPGVMGVQEYFKENKAPKQGCEGLVVWYDCNRWRRQGRTLPGRDWCALKHRGRQWQMCAN